MHCFHCPNHFFCFFSMRFVFYTFLIVSFFSYSAQGVSGQTSGVPPPQESLATPSNQTDGTTDDANQTSLKNSTATSDQTSESQRGTKQSSQKSLSAKTSEAVGSEGKPIETTQSVTPIEENGNEGEVQPKIITVPCSLAFMLVSEKDLQGMNSQDSTASGAQSTTNSTVRHKVRSLGATPSPTQQDQDGELYAVKSSEDKANRPLIAQRIDCPQSPQSPSKRLANL